MIDLDYRVHGPVSTQRGIGLVGAGEIVNVAHLPAYRQAGLRVLAITDLDPVRARQTAERYGIPTVYDTLDALLSDPAVEVVDIAVPASANPAISAACLGAGRHVLVQKPMAERLDDAIGMVRAADSAGRYLVVNHQMRWSPAVRAVSDVLRRGLIGTPLEYLIRISIRTDWSPWPWLASREYPELWYHSIHYLDTIRGWFGDPVNVSAVLGRAPGSAVSQSRTSALLRHADGLSGALHVFHDSTAPPDDWVATFAIEGSLGRIEGRFGLLLGYPTGLSDTIRVWAPGIGPGGSMDVELDGRWFPDAFLGPMASLLDAVEMGSEPETSGRATLGTLRLLGAIERSHATGQTVTPG